VELSARQSPQFVDDRNCRDRCFLLQKFGINGTKTEGRMDRETADRTILFAGDLDDPWVGSIVDSISYLGSVCSVKVSGPLPARLFGENESPGIVIIHRLRLSQADVCRIEGYQRKGLSKPLPRIILCYSPYVRYAELERCAAVVDLVIPEASALDTLPHHVSRYLDDGLASSRDLPRGLVQVEVVSTDQELNALVSEACLAAGYGSPASTRLAYDNGRDQSAENSLRSHPVVTLWDVPVLEPGWPELLANRSRLGPLIAVLGFADRSMVGLAMASGAIACLDLPFNVDDMIYLLDRVARSIPLGREVSSPGRAEAPHAVPPPPVSRARMGRLAILNRGPRVAPWPADNPPPRINNGKSAGEPS
jgi:hypothetical protein